MNYSSIPRWKIWTSIVFLVLAGIYQLINSIKSFLAKEPILASILGFVIALVVIYFAVYIPIKIMYEEAR